MQTIEFNESRRLKYSDKAKVFKGKFLNEIQLGQYLANRNETQSKFSEAHQKALAEERLKMYQDLDLLISKYSLLEFKERINDSILHTLTSLLTMQDD